MNCPKCGTKTKVVWSGADCESVERKRECLDPECRYRFDTLELEKDVIERLGEGREDLSQSVECSQKL